MALNGRSLPFPGLVTKLVNQRALFMSVGVVAFCSVAVKIAGMLRDIVLASEFGTSDAADAFIAAWVLPQFFALIVGNALGGALIPFHAEAKQHGGNERAHHFLAEMLLVSVAVMGLITVMLIPLRDLLLPIVTSNFSSAKLAETRELWLIMLPAVFVFAMINLWSSILHTEDRFALAAASPIVISICTIAALWIYPQGGIRSPAVGFLIGTLLQAIWMVVGMQRHGLNILPRWFGGLSETRGALGQFLPFMINGVLFGGIGVVDQAMAATLGKGNLAILSYGNKLVLPILAIGSTALATVVYPRFSRLVADRDWIRLQRQVKAYMSMTLAVGIAVMIVIVLLSEFIVRLVFERGAFGPDDTIAVARVQMIYALMIPAYTLSHLLSRVLNAMRQTRLLAIGSGIIFAFNISADYLFKEWLGIEGIALATVLNYLLALAFNGYLFRRLINEQLSRMDLAT